MAGFFISDLRRALGSAGFFLACLITILIWVVSTLDLLPIPDETVLTIYENGNVGQMQILMPAVAALPYGTAFSDEWRSRYFRLQLLRGNAIEWLLSKFLVAILCGALAVGCGGILFVLLVSLSHSALPPADMATNIIENIRSNGQATSLLRAENIWLYLLACTGFRMLAAMMWAGVALAISIYVPSRFYAVLSPFLLSVLLRSFSDWVGIPYNWQLNAIVRGETMIKDAGRAYAFASARYGPYILLCAGVFLWHGKRRVCNA